MSMGRRTGNFYRSSFYNLTLGFVNYPRFSRERIGRWI